MSFFVVPKHARKEVTLPTPITYADILYDHAGFLRTNGGQLGPGFPLLNKKVAVVGAGPAGLCAGYLLNRMGATVEMFEASDRVGGRIDSYPPLGPGDPARFEMGAMRVPPSEQLFQYFWSDFALPAPSPFPDPGDVDTKIIFQNTVYDWPAQGSAPPIFNNVATGWKNFAGSQTMQNLTTWLSNPTTFGQAQQLWQQLIFNAGQPLGPEQGYSMISFYQGLVQAFVENASTYQCKPWSAQDFALFGALGLGSGGFGPLYQVNFAEIVRLVINGLETNQQFYGAGLAGLTDTFASRLSSQGAIFSVNTKVTGVNYYGGLQQPVLVNWINQGTPGSGYYDAAVIATTTRSMQVDMDITEPPTSSGRSKEQQGDLAQGRQVMPISNDQATAIQELHLMNSSKLFVLCSSKFWAQGGMPQNIQTDGLVRGLYCLEYPGSNYGVVLVSYTWGDDSTKYIALTDPNERLQVLLRSLSPYTTDPGMSAFLNGLQSTLLPAYTRMIDWQAQRQYYGAFKLNYPGQDVMNQTLYNQYQATSNRVFLAGDSVGWCGGWIEGALQTAVNAAASVVQNLAGASALYPGNPMTQSPSLYNYGP
jgi:tryptophan 2-monooxygenase